ncbi:CD1107 family mobile element protein [Solobacterium moorei]|uniref:CD1107 family mobile element protein n=1 Tax=Solobacterium moorei TaxID=102148 RepID=UPI002B2AA6B8|nr:hypothetical protein RGT18_16310 [Solobacterium moorei]BET22481.1 hypothetical protein RGT18_20690 [Solobacterium moorei]
MKTSLKNKRITAIVVAFTLLMGGVLGVLKVGAKTVFASNEPPEKYETYYELKFEDHTSDDTFRGFYHLGKGNKEGQPLNFKFFLSKSFEEKGGVVLDKYNETFTNENMDKVNQLDDLRYMTKKTYPYYRIHNVGTGAFTSIVSPRDKDNYYIGDITENAEERTVKGKKANVIVYTCPVLQLNRNIEKVTVDYEGELKEETKNAIIGRVKEANPNINNVKEIKIVKDKLIIETWNRFHTGVPYLELPLEDLYKRVSNASTQTDNKDTKDQESQTKSEVKVKYQYQDGKVYKEYSAYFDKNQVIDASDLEMLPDNMSFNDNFVSYKVKCDGSDSIIRIVKKLESNAQTQTEKQKTEDKGTQTELSKDDISKMEKESKELQEKLDKLSQEIKDKDKLSDKQKEKIKDLEEKIDKLKEKLEKGKDDKDLSADMKKEIDKLTEKIKELEKKTNEVGKATVTHNPTVTPISPISGMKTGTGNFPQTSVSDTGKGSSSQDNTGKITKDTNVDKTDGKEKEVRYPNKLTPKQPANNSGQDSSMDGSSKNVNTNKGVASAPSKARGTVTENKDNANKDYPIHHGDSSDKKETDMYSADARQFVTFTTKNGKTFHLIINHDEDSENVMLLTEVSEDDLLNMVEKKEAPKQEIKKEEPEKEEPKPVKKEESSNMGTYLILILVVAGALGAGYYFKVVKKKEDKELEGFEEEDDDFFSEAEESENEVDETETEDKEDELE